LRVRELWRELFASRFFPDWTKPQSDDENDSHKIRHKFFKWPRQIELATNASSSEKVGSINFATLFEIMATWRFCSISRLQFSLDSRE